MAAADMYVDAAAGGGGTGLSWAQAWNLAEWEADVEGSAEAGDRYFVRGGTYALTNAFATVLDGTTQAPIQIIGVAAGTANEPPVFSDWASGDARPLMACGANALSFDNNWIINNLRATGSNAPVFRADSTARFYNCKVTNSGTGLCFDHGGAGNAKYVDCEAINSSTGDGFDLSAVGNMAAGCLATGGDSGFTMSGNSGLAAVFCIFNGCNEGINIGTALSPLVMCCTFHDCVDGILGSTAYFAVAMNNIFNDCTDGASWSSDYSASHWFDYNNWEGNTDDVDFVTKGPNATAVDPDFENAVGGDFSLNATSACIGAGFAIGLGV